MNTLNGLPIFYATIEDNMDGIQAIAFVEAPATEVAMLKFNKDKERLSFVINDEDKKIVVAPIMVADTPIFRVNANGEQYYVSYTPEIIEQMRDKYFKEGLIYKFNIEHDEAQPVTGVYLVESYIVNEDTKAPTALGDIKPGTWIGAFKIENEDLWKEIKAGSFNGISLEGFFSYTETKNDEEMSAMMLILKQLRQLK